MNPTRDNAMKAADWVKQFLEKSPNASIDYIIKQAHHAGYGLRPHEVTPIRRLFMMNRAVLRCLACGEQGHMSKDCPKVVKTADVVIPPKVIPPPVPAKVDEFEEVQLPPAPERPPLELGGEEIKEEDADDADADDDDSDAEVSPDYLLRTPKRQTTLQRQAYMEELLLANPELMPEEVESKLRGRFGVSLGVARIVSKVRVARELHGLPPLPVATEALLHEKRRRDRIAVRMVRNQKKLQAPLFPDEVPAVIPRVDSPAAIRASAPSLSSTLARAAAITGVEEERKKTAGPSMKDGLRAISAQISALANEFGLSVLKFELGADGKVKVAYETRTIAEETF